jgi:hypothetical protein
MERYKIGVFDDVSKARKAVDDALIAGVSRDAITLVLPDDQPDEGMGPENKGMMVHPTSSTERAHWGGAIGGAVGGFIGSVAMYLLGKLFAPEFFQAALGLGLVFGALTGAMTGGYLAMVLPQLINAFTKKSPQDLLGSIGQNPDTRRASSAGAIGGLFGAVAGTLGSYLFGVPDVWYFVTQGLWAAAASLIVGGLVGAMSGRGLAPRAVGQFEDLIDAGHNILVSIDISKLDGTPALIEELFRRDGATMVRTA